MFVDFAGDKIPVYDQRTGVVDFEAPVFVAVLGASSYTFVEATRNQELSCWIDAHIRALEFFGGAVEVVVPDNTKTGVKHPCRYEPDLNPTYREMAEHYGVAVIPTRPYKPRDKAKAEVGVQLTQRWIVAALRRRKFLSLTAVVPGDDDLRVVVETGGCQPLKVFEGANVFADGGGEILRIHKAQILAA